MEKGVDDDSASRVTGDSVEERIEASKTLSLRQKIIKVVRYTPRRCRYNKDAPPRFSMALNLLFGFAATFTVANLYYNHPILNKLATDFSVSNERASLIPTLAQTGYAAGLLFLCPLGDLFPRRPLILILIWFTATVWYVDTFSCLVLLRAHTEVLQDRSMHHEIVHRVSLSDFPDMSDHRYASTQYDSLSQ